MTFVANGRIERAFYAAGTSNERQNFNERASTSVMSP